MGVRGTIVVCLGVLLAVTARPVAEEVVVGAQFRLSAN